jgi:Fic family protein
VQCAYTHYQFETIHPFHDGNGRVGRLLIILQLIQLGLLSAPLIYPSVFFERRRDDYNAMLQAVRETGAWDEWVGFFAEGMREQAQATIQLTRMILNLKEHLQEQVKNVSRRASVTAVLDAFFQEPVLTLAEIVQRARMARHSAQIGVDVLLDQNILGEITGKQKGRVYACRPILDIIFRDHVAPQDGPENA